MPFERVWYRSIGIVRYFRQYRKKIKWWFIEGTWVWCLCIALEVRINNWIKKIPSGIYEEWINEANGFCEAPCQAFDQPFNMRSTNIKKIIMQKNSFKSWEITKASSLQSILHGKITPKIMASLWIWSTLWKKTIEWFFKDYNQKS